MDAKELKVVIVGVGEMGKIGVQTLIDHGVKIVAAVDINEKLIGRDVAEVAGYPPIGVAIEKDLAEAIRRESPNLASFASDPGIENIRDDMILCAENKINVVTTIMDVYYRNPSVGHVFDEIDQAFKDNGVSLFSSGINDIWWSGIGIDIAGTCKKIEKLDFSQMLPLNGMGVGVARDFRVGWDPADYMKEMEGVDLSMEESCSGPYMSLMKNAEILNLTVTDTKITTEPCTCDRDIEMPQWDMVIKAGTMLGSVFTITLTTAEGITLSNQTYIKVLIDDEKPGTTWTVKGEPDLKIELNDIVGEITTSATTINRIPQVIHAKPGIVTLAELPERPVYLHGIWKEI